MRNYIGETEGTDWDAILTNANKFVETYLGWRIARKQPTSTTTTPPTDGRGTTVVYQQGMSSTTKALLIGGGVLVAGLLVYSLTKKK